MKIVDFIVCDDVRQELGNKVSLMGIFSDAIVLQQEVAWPIRMNLSVFTRLELEADEIAPDSQVLAVDCNGKSIAEVELVVASKTGSRLLTFLVGLKPITIPEAGALGFRIDLKRGDENVTEPFIRSVKVQSYLRPADTD